MQQRSPEKLRVVIDTSSLVSYVLTRGDMMRRVIAAWEAGQFVLLTSPQTRQELALVLVRPALRQRSSVDLSSFAEGLERFSEHVSGKLQLPGASRDAKDDKFIACAVEGRAHYLISSDQDLLSLGRYQSTCILNPGQFLVALTVARSPAAALRDQYSREALRSIRARLCLDAQTAEKLAQVIASPEA